MKNEHDWYNNFDNKVELLTQAKTRIKLLEEENQLLKKEIEVLKKETEQTVNTIFPESCW
jgi:hypothetical protein